MRRNRITTASARPSGNWAVVVTVLLAALVPAGCVLWFMTEAMRNERLAVRQKLTDAYRGQLAAMAGRLDGYWRDKAEALNRASGDTSPAEVFASLVTSGVCDGAIVYDAEGVVVYPRGPADFVDAGNVADPQWVEARRLEYEDADLPAAADAYAKISAAGTGDYAARAMRARVRCLLQSGRKAEAVKVLSGLPADPKYARAADPGGRLIVPNMQLLAMELLADDTAALADVTESLRRRLADYSGPEMSSGQRVFLMTRFLERHPRTDFPTLTAERLAGEYLDADIPDRPDPAFSGPLGAIGVRTLGSADGRIVALFRESTVAAAIKEQIATDPPLTGARVVAHCGERPGGAAGPLLTMRVGPHMPSQRLSLYLDGPDPFARAAGKQNVAYLLIGGLGTLTITVLALCVAGYLNRQMKLTRLKNNLIATVSHELKTPLSSMRVLVDTLIEGRLTDRTQAAEYLQLIARENLRLSRLIDNFLTFSRMERNKRTFEFTEVRVAELVDTAVESVAERFASPKCRLDTGVADGLAPVTGDRDALVTVVLNLLDNAWKYSGDDKRISLRAFARDGCICLEVRDNGIGMSPRTSRRIFHRFYQADQTLARSAGGCGLGLSIVRFIVDAHGGSIDVASRPGEGSTFTVTLPAGDADASGAGEQKNGRTDQ